MLDVVIVAANENLARRSSPIPVKMKADRIGPPRSRVELGLMIGKQISQLDAPDERVALEADISTQCRELTVRSADARAFEIIDIEVGEQVKARFQLDDLDAIDAVVRNEGRVA